MLPTDNLYVLMSKYLAHQISHDECLAVERWKEKHPEEFERLRKIWEETQGHKRAFNVRLAQQRLDQRIDALEAESPPLKRRTYYRWKVAANISLLLLAVTVYCWKVLPGEEVRWAEKRTERSQVATLTLSDGSQVTLNTDSKIRYASDFDQSPVREVLLEGEAFFAVTHDPRPFVVRTNGMSIQVLGTTFSVSAYPEDDLGTVTVATGRVEVDLPEGLPTRVLLPERQVVFNRREKTWKEQVAVVTDELAWMKGELVFDNAPLSQVVPVLERYYDVTVIFEQKALQDCYLTAHFKEETLFHVLEAIGYTNTIVYTFHQDTVTLSGAGCDP